MSFTPRQLGSTNLQVGPLGIASSYGATAHAFEEAFEKGCNYFVWNTFMKGRSKEMREAIRNIIKSGNRDKLVIAMHSYGHNAIINRLYLEKSLKQLGIDHIDVMLLGYYSWKPASGILNSARRLKEKGLVSYIGMTGHSRTVIAKLVKENRLDVYHVRYNAVHTGAERDIFPSLPAENKPGIVAFTATRWRQLLDPRKMPEGEEALKASDCYRFALSNPYVDVCLTGPKTQQEMKENLHTLGLGPLKPEEMERIRRIGEFMYSNK